MGFLFHLVAKIDDGYWQWHEEGFFSSAVTKHEICMQVCKGQHQDFVLSKSFIFISSDLECRFILCEMR